MESSLTTHSVPLEKPIILCVEDNPSYLRLRTMVLERNGYHVIAVLTADEALKALRSSPVALILLDQMLEGTTGTELAKEMKTIKPKGPIILLSGSVPEDLSCVDVYVRKGEPTEKFLALVRDIVQRSYL